MKELLVVIVLIAILAATLFSVIARAKELAKKMVCLSILKQLSLAIAMNCNDFDDKYSNSNNTLLWIGLEFRWSIMPYFDIDFKDADPNNPFDDDGTSALLYCPRDPTHVSLDDTFYF